MKVYAGIDLHSDNVVLGLTGEKDNILFNKRLPNDLNLILGALRPHQEDIVGVVVESTYNWYWLVDGLMDAGYRVHLANTAAIVQYEGIKYTDDTLDVLWLAKLLRLELLPEGYIYPKEERSVRDLLRKRSQLVRQRTANLLSIQNLVARNCGHSLSSNQVRKLDFDAVDKLMGNEHRALAVKTNLMVMHCLDEQIANLEKVVKTHIQLRPEFKPLLTVNGIGEILGLTIMLETGDIRRFQHVGNYSSYCRCVGSIKLTNRKRKGSGNTKNGNRYLAWAFIEAANFAVRYCPQIKRYYQRKRAKTNGIVAIKTVAHKLARACYYILRDQVPFDINRTFV
ncbi:transposase [Gammaproteobacteria bacterium]